MSILQNYTYKAVKFSYLAALIFCVNDLFAQGTESRPAPAKFLARLGFTEFNGGVILLKASVEGFSDTLNFILDSGSGGASIDSSNCEEFKIVPKSSDSSVYGIGGKRQAKFIYQRRLLFKGLTTPPVNFHVNDYSLLSSVYGIKIDGLLGYHFFRNYIIKINFDRSYMDVYAPGSYNYGKRGHLLNPVISFIPSQNSPAEEKEEKMLNLFLDSGAGLAILLTDDAANDINLLNGDKKPVTILAEGMSDKVEMLLTTLNKIKVGPYTFKDIPTFIYRDSINTFHYPSVAGLLGNELMSRFNVTYNYPSAQIHIVPNKRFKHKFDYSYTGMSVYYHDGSIIIEEIVPGSPADIFGFKSGDILVGINNNFSGNLLNYKNMLNKENEQMTLYIKRKGAVMPINFITADIRDYGKKDEKRRNNLKKKNAG